MNGHTLARWRACAGLPARDLARNRAVAGVFLIAPPALYLLIEVTTGARPIPFQLHSAGDALLTAPERDLSMLFIAMAVISGLSAFLCFTMVAHPASADRRLVFEGYRPSELLAGKTAVLGVAAAIVAVYVTALLPFFFQPKRAAGVFAGFLLTALVYGAVGMAIGAVVRRELEGILLILLLVNVDAGWLQNPVFYAHAQNRELIRWLPGHHAGQVTMLSAFTESALAAEIARSLLYTLCVLVLAAAAYGRRVRVAH